VSQGNDYDLFNAAFIGSDSTASNGRVINEQCIVKYAEGSGFSYMNAIGYCDTQSFHLLVNILDALKQCMRAQHGQHRSEAL
jgi:hypothetical protein